MTDLKQPTEELLALILRAVSVGDFDGAERIAEVVSVREPAHEAVVEYLVSRALQRGNAMRALHLSRGGVTANPRSARLQFQFGLAQMAFGQLAAAAQTFANAHALAPAMTAALLWQADCEHALGRADARLRCQLRALTAAERNGELANPERLSPPVRQRIAAAIDAVHTARREAIESAIAPLRSKHGAAAIARIERAFAHFWGEPRLQPTHPKQWPTLLFVPDLPDQAWFEREQFPYLKTLEAATDAIREEMLAVLAADVGMTPYVDMPDTAPAAPIWRQLNRSPDWSGYHLYRHGERIDANCARCPKTMAVLESIPLMRIDDHAPEILFSILKPHTHIPPHTGVINGRLTVHLPLIVPENCGALRAGDEQRAWREGECLIFDDSFVHEAWNESDHTRVVLILDAWNPYLSDAERAAMATATAALGVFNRDHGGEDITHEN
jgi:aspartate beta-hydroxylase